MRDLTLFTLGENKYGIWQDEAPTVKEFQTIHWLPPVPKHIAGLSILDGQPVTLFDLPVCVGLSPITKEKQCYPTLFLDHEKNIAGFIVDFIIGHFAIQPEAVYPMPDFLRTPIIDTCVMYDSEPIPVINISRLLKSAQNAGFEPCVAELRICGARPQKTSSIKSVRIFECGGETFAVSEARIEKSGVKLGRAARPAPLPPYVSGITFHNEKPVSLIHLSKRMKLARDGIPELMLIADIEGQTFGLLIDSEKGQWHANDYKLKPLPPLVQGDWMQDAVLHGKEIIPILEPGGLISNHTDSLAGTPFPQRYAPSSQFNSIFGNEDVQVCEFSLLGARQALPQNEVEDQFKVKPYRSLPNVMSIVTGVAQHAGELLPVLDPAACFGRRSLVTPDWQMLLVKNGNFCALVLTEAIFGERLLPVKIHRRLPFEEPHSLVYGCYPDEATVRLILNVEALAVHFNKTLFKEFFTNLSQKMALEPMDIGLEPEVETTEVGGRPVQKANEQIEEDIEPVELAEAEELFEPEESPALITSTAAGEVEEKRDIKETTEIAPPDIITAAVADSEEISAAEDKTDFEETQKIAETKAEGTHVSDSEESGPEPEPAATELSEPIKEPEKPAEPEISEKQTAETKLEVSQTEISEQIEPGLDPDTTDVDGFMQKAKEQIEEGIEPVEFTETKELVEPEDPPASIAFLEAEEAEEKREIKEVAEVAPPGIATAAADSEELSGADKKTALQETQKNAKIKAHGTHVTVSEVFGSESESEAKQEEQVDEIIELTELVEIEEIIELTELVEVEKLIEIEKAPELNVLTSIADTALPVDKGVSDNSKADAREKLKRKFVGAVFVSIILIGLLTVSLYPSGLFKPWLVDKESEKPSVPVTANHLSPTKPKTSLPPKFEKPPPFSKDPKLAEVQNESTKTIAALGKPEPSTAKHLKPPAKMTPVEPSDSKIIEIEGVNSGAPATAAKPKPSLSKHLKPPTKTVPAEPSGSIIFKIEEVSSGETAAAEVHGLVPKITLQQAAPSMSSPESTDIMIHKVEKGDTLWNISKRYTGTGFNYPHVAKENQITNPDLILIKQKVRVSKKYGIQKE